LQDDEPRRELKRLFSFSIVSNIAVEIRSGERDDERPIGMKLVETADRVGAAPRMQGDQDIAPPVIVTLAYPHPVAELLENSGPAQGGDAIAIVDAQRRGSD
jgi:hypothetical protein